MSHGVHGSVVVPMTDQVSVIGFGSVDMLSDDVADSPLVSTRGSGDLKSVGVVVNMSF